MSYLYDSIYDNKYSNLYPNTQISYVLDEYLKSSPETVVSEDEYKTLIAEFYGLNSSKKLLLTLMTTPVNIDPKQTQLVELYIKKFVVENKFDLAEIPNLLCKASNNEFPIKLVQLLSTLGCITIDIEKYLKEYLDILPIISEDYRRFIVKLIKNGINIDEPQFLHYMATYMEHNDKFIQYCNIFGFETEVLTQLIKDENIKLIRLWIEKGYWTTPEMHDLTENYEIKYLLLKYLVDRHYSREQAENAYI